MQQGWDANINNNNYWYDNNQPTLRQRPEPTATTFGTMTE
jgi:hypothetical protein